MRVLVCGSRTYADTRSIWDLLDGLLFNHQTAYDVTTLAPFTLIEGGARGADAIAADWASMVAAGRPDMVVGAPFKHLRFPADWERIGNRAGFVRNKQMLDEGKPDVVYAFVDKPLAQSKGTAMMVGLARDAGVRTYVVEAR